MPKPRRPSEDRGAIEGRVVHAEFRSPLPGYLIEIAVDGEPVGRARVERDGTFGVPIESADDDRTFQVRVLDPSGSELAQRAVSRRDASLELDVRPRREGPRADDWTAVRRDLAGTAVSTVGELVAELEAPTQPRVAEWSPSTRREMLRAVELAFLDPTGVLREHVGADAINFRSLQHPPARLDLEHQLRDPAAQDATEAFALLRRRLASSPALRESPTLLTELGPIGTRLVPSTFDDVLRAAELAFEDQTHLRRIAPDLISLIELSEPPAGIDPEGFATALRLARNALANRSVREAEVSRHLLNSALGTLELGDGIEEALHRVGIASARDLLGTDARQQLVDDVDLDAESADRLQRLGVFAQICDDGQGVARLARRFRSLQELAASDEDTVAQELHGTRIASEAGLVHRRAKSLTSLVGDRLRSLGIALAPANAARTMVGGLETTLPGSVVTDELLPNTFLEGCEPCSPCESALSPAAYLVDLLDFVSDQFGFTLGELEERFCVDFAELAVDCGAVDRERPLIDITNDILANFVAERRGQDWRNLSPADLDALYNEFRALDVADGAVPEVLEVAWVDYLREIGTDPDEVVAAMGGSDADRQTLADRLALATADLATLAVDPQAVTRSHLATLAGLLLRSRRERLVRSLSASTRDVAYATRVAELITAIPDGAADYDAQMAAAEAAASAHADGEVASAMPAIIEVAQAEAAIAARGARERVEQVLLPGVRTNLAIISLAEATAHPVRDPNPTNLDQLEDYLSIDLRTGSCKGTTEVALAIGALQGLVQRFLLGKEPFPAVTKFAHRQWAWTRSYSIWAAVATIFLYPETFLFPRFRTDRTESFDRMVDVVEDQVANRRVAQEALDSFAEELRDFTGVKVEASTEAADIAYFFTLGRLSRYLYYSTLDKAQRWSGWHRIDIARGDPPVEGLVPTPQIMDATSVGDKPYLLIRTADFTAQLLGPGEAGDFTEPIHVADDVSFARAVGVTTTYSQFLFLLVRTNTDRWGDAQTSEDHHGRAAYHAFHLEPGGQVEEFTHRAWLSSSATLIGMTLHSPNSEYTSVDHPRIYFSWLHGDQGGHTISIRSHRIDNLSKLEDPGLGLRLDSWTWSSKSGTLAIDWPVQPYRYRLVSLGARSRDDDVYADRLVVGYHRPGTESTWRLHIIDGDVTEMALVAGREGDGPAETHSARFETIVALGGETYTVLGSHLVIVPFVGWTIPTRWRALGQLTLAAEASPAAKLELDARQVLTTDGRQALIDSQVVHFDHFVRPGYARRYIEELFLHAPVALAEVLRQEERYEHAAEFLGVVFRPYAGEAENRFSYEGFRRQDTAGPHFEHRDDSGYLENPFDPHAIAKIRPHTYARYVVMQAVENLLDWADTQYVRDTQESVDRARELYEAAGEILGLDDLPPDLCATGYNDLLIRVLKARGYNATVNWYPVLDGIWREVTRNGRIATHARAETELSKILAGNGSDGEQRAEAAELLIRLRSEEDRPVRTIGEVFDNRERLRNNTEFWHEAARWFASDSTPNLDRPPINGDLTPTFFEFGFCVPPNPAFDTLRFRVGANLAKIRQCQNYAGVHRTLDTYAAAADPTALIEAAAAGGGDIEGFTPAEPPPLFRYSFLADRARHLASLAQHVESYLLSSLEKRDAADYSLLQAKSDLMLKREQVALEALRVREAADRVKLATLQRDRSQFTSDHFDSLLTASTSALERLALDMMYVSLALPSSISVTTGMSSGVSVGYSPSGILQTLAGIFNQQASYARRAEEWRYQRERAEWEIKIGDIGIDIADDQVAIVEQESEIAALSADLASKTVEFLAAQFTGPELYRWMVGELRKLYRRHLNLAVATAHAAQTALAFELQEQLSFIGYQYFEMKREGLLGGEKLMLDIERMEQHRIRRAERRQELTKTISLRSMMPVEFQQLRKTGQIEIATQAEWFDRDFPGHFMRLIKSVELSVVALVHPIDGMHATLTSHGLSRVVAGPPFVEETVLQHPPETVSLSSGDSDSGLFQLRLDDPMLLPFEGMGCVTTWTLQMPKGSNRFDFSGLYDVLMTIRYTARADAGHRVNVVARLEQETGGNVFFGMKNTFPDAWFHFQNPRFIHNPANYGYGPDELPPPYTLRFELDGSYLPPNEEDVEIIGTRLLLDPADSFPVPVDVDFRPTGRAVAIPADGLQTDGNPLSIPHFNGQSPIGEWTIRVRNEAAAADFPELFAGSDVVDGQNRLDVTRLANVIIVIDYKARVRYD